MWTNGPLINTAVDQVRSHFPGATVDLICHSKGGVDAQTATVYYGTASKVNRLITLSSPHHGTPLADLAWSSWAGWLASLIGYKNEGNRVLQTGYMASFRAQTDAYAAAHTLPTFTAGGTKAGPFWSSYYWGGIVIGRTSDGVVPTDSSELSYQTGRLFTRYWNHDEVHQGVNAWPYLATNLAQAVAAKPLGITDSLKVDAAPDPDPTLDRLYRGGVTQQGVALFTFPINVGQQRVELALETSQRPRFVEAISPSGRVIRFRAARHQGDGLLPNGTTTHLSLMLPEAGSWRVQITTQHEDAYLFLAQFPDDAGIRIPYAQALTLARGPVDRQPIRVGGVVPEAVVATERILPPLRIMGLPAFKEPVILNQTLTLTWPDGRERSLILTTPE